MKSNIFTLNGKLLVLPTDRTTVLENGMTMRTERGKRDYRSGIVIKVQEGFKVREGYIIHYPEFAATPITVEGKDYHIVDINDVALYEQI